MDLMRRLGKLKKSVSFFFLKIEFPRESVYIE